VPAEQSAGSDSPQRRQGEQTEEAVKAKPVDQGEQPVPKAEEQAAAAETNENLATPVPQHMPLASIKSESPPDSNGKAEHPINLLGTVRGTGRKRPITFSPMGKFA
jgi:hypothetical protein